MYLGIDLTSNGRRPSGVATLDAEGHLLDLRLLGEDDAILQWIERWGAGVVGIDSPISLPVGLCCLEGSCPCRALAPDGFKAAERELRRRGIGLYATTKRSIIKAMIYRAIGLRHHLEGRGVQVLEVYPYACKVALFGRSIPKKSTLDGRSWLHERLCPLIPGLAGLPSLPSHDELDALLVAYTAYLWAEGLAVSVGDPAEGLIYFPPPGDRSDVRH